MDDALPARLESVSPATGEVLGSVQVTPPKEVAAAVQGAASAQRLWGCCGSGPRARHAARRAGGHRRGGRAPDLLCREQGRPRAEAELMELCRRSRPPALAEHGPKILSGERTSLSRVIRPVTRGRWSYEPLGVVAVLGPAAEPFATPLGDAAVALMAGNGVVLKPSPYACLLGERIARVFARAGLPDGRCASGTATPRRAGRWSTRRSHRCASPAPHRRARGRRGLRARRQAQRCWSSAGKEGAPVCAEATLGGPPAAWSGPRSPTRASAAARSSAPSR